jgi:hypothetical protein
MPTLVTMIGGWLAFNTVVFGTLMLRRSRPQTREKLFQWIIASRPHRNGSRAVRPGVHRHS